MPMRARWPTAGAQVSSAAILGPRGGAGSICPPGRGGGWEEARRRGQILPGTARATWASRVAHDIDRGVGVGDRRRAAHVVHHMVDPAESPCGIEEDRQQVVQLNARRVVHLERAGCEDLYALVEEGVTAHPVTLESGCLVRDLERRIAVGRGVFHPGRLTWRVVRHLVLEEDVRAVLPVPDHLRLLVVLHEEAVRGAVIALHENAALP